MKECAGGLGKQANLLCACDRLCATADAQLAQDLADVPFGGAGRDDKLRGNLAVGVTGRDQVEYGHFPRGQRVGQRLHRLRVR